MTPAFLFPICDDCGETLTSPACNCGSHICAKPDSASASSIASTSAPSISSRHARNIELPVFAIAPAPHAVAVVKLADAA